ncbi:MAG: general secretion pathway protein GspB [Gammaproteobacteria bacterium]|nr:general secretion pathway protein GspB [Gammaproteobacteria bacterium]
MYTSINPWWSLPVLTAILGGVAAVAVFPTQPIAEIAAERVAEVTVIASVKTDLLITKQVALPPPSTYQPITYQATRSKTSGMVVVKKTKPNVIAATPSPEISSDLVNRFNQAIADMAADELKPTTVTQHPKALTRYPQWYQNLVPSLDFSSHIYSSEKQDRWVKVNQQVVKEGELINAELRLVGITPEEVIIELQQRQFTLPALSSW